MVQQHNEHGEEVQQNDEHEDVVQQNDECEEVVQQNDEHEDVVQQNDEHEDVVQQNDEYEEEVQQNDEHEDMVQQNDECEEVIQRNDEHEDVVQQNDECEEESDGSEEEVEQNSESEQEEMLQLLQSEHEVCELQFENEVLQSHNLELERELEMWKANYCKCFQSLEAYKGAYANSLQHVLHLDVSQKIMQFGACFILNDDEKTHFYTGLPSYAVFQKLFTLLKTCATKEITPKCSLINEFFLTLTKLRLGLLHKDISYRMNLTESLVSKIFHKWIDLMYCELRQMITWPDRETLRKNLPACFRRHYVNVVSIIDCFEIFIERPSSLEARAATYSQYKKHNTVKFLIGVSPTGSISFVSKGWGGRVSDKIITQKSGFLDKICAYDVIMADRGFNIVDDLAIRCATLEVPAYTRGKKQLSIAEVEKTRQLARVRIHVERSSAY